MKITGVELRTVAMPLVAPFRTSFGTETVREAVLLRAVTDEAEGWGECCAGTAPLYSCEYTQGAADALTRYLIPAVKGVGGAHQVGPALAAFKGHRTAKAALEMAVLDAELRAREQPLSQAFGAIRTHVPCGVSVGITDTVPELLDLVAEYLAAGYQRIKLKIEPGWDIEPVAAVRERFGDIPLQVDANAAYRLDQARHLARLDPFDLTLLEQPLAEDDLLGHAELAKRLTTPICLDESIVDARAAAAAIKLNACGIVNIKPGRVGGYLEAKRIHDVCVANDVPVWCGGMLETGLGRAANVALAALPGFQLPGDTSASDRYYTTDITEPFRLAEGRLRVPTGPGLGVTPIPELLQAVTVSTRWIPV
ncbi:o-succinylbenzoate synthase [Streptomyces sp. ADI92-24]|uniref:o-succinylbenzoate synthase n=1 Tax=Streptomyces sp. ADI92-24 TaxID=1522756 RepID=UPI000F5513EE|nr:o-succinylbenzoate synthase [Streptomyces sp. ADI92-24]RPK44817.1 o-succinylbenzoate synthase [Streptomyces sp. ADI92-24]